MLCNLFVLTCYAYLLTYLLTYLFRVFNTPGNAEILEILLFFLLEIFWKFAKSPGNFLAEFVCLLLL